MAASAAAEEASDPHSLPLSKTRRRLKSAGRSLTGHVGGAMTRSKRYRSGCVLSCVMHTAGALSRPRKANVYRRGALSSV